MINPTTGNMYEWITHTWNPIKGQCFHGCSYCFMKKLVGDKLKAVRLDDKELKTDLGSGNFIFVGSSTDDWAANNPDEWILKTLDHCDAFDNRYLFQSKNPQRFLQFLAHPVYRKAVFCTTIETNRWYPDVMNNSPSMRSRADAMAKMHELGFTTYITAEPLLDFDLPEMVELLLRCAPAQVNIGKNTNWKVQVPEPTPEKVQALVNALQGYTLVEPKSNAKKWGIYNR